MAPEYDGSSDLLNICVSEKTMEEINFIKLKTRHSFYGD